MRYLPLIFAALLSACTTSTPIPADPLTGLYTVAKFVNDVDCSSRYLWPDHSDIDLVYLERDNGVITINDCNETCLEQLWVFPKDVLNSVSVFTDHDSNLCSNHTTVNWLDIGDFTIRLNSFYYTTSWSEETCGGGQFVPYTCQQAAYILQPTDIWSLDTGEL